VILRVSVWVVDRRVGRGFAGPGYVYVCIARKLPGCDGVWIGCGCTSISLRYDHVACAC
jgi:hypothetical protein